MIIVSLLVSGKEQGQAIADCIIKNKFSLNVFGNYFDYFNHKNVNSKENEQAYVLQFVTKSLLFAEIEATLNQEFPKSDLSICATPLVHIAFNLHNRIKKRVIGIRSDLQVKED